MRPILRGVLCVFWSVVCIFNGYALELTYEVKVLIPADGNVRVQSDADEYLRQLRLNGVVRKTGAEKNRKRVVDAFEVKSHGYDYVGTVVLNYDENSGYVSYMVPTLGKEIKSYQVREVFDGRNTYEIPTYGPVKIFPGDKRSTLMRAVDQVILGAHKPEGSSLVSTSKSSKGRTELYSFVRGGISSRAKFYYQADESEPTCATALRTAVTGKEVPEAEYAVHSFRQIGERKYASEVTVKRLSSSGTLLQEERYSLLQVNNSPIPVASSLLTKGRPIIDFRLGESKQVGYNWDSHLKEIGELQAITELPRGKRTIPGLFFVGLGLLMLAYRYKLRGGVS